MNSTKINVGDSVFITVDLHGHGLEVGKSGTVFAVHENSCSIEQCSDTPGCSMIRVLTYDEFQLKK